MRAREMLRFAYITMSRFEKKKKKKKHKTVQGVKTVFTEVDDGEAK